LLSSDLIAKTLELLPEVEFVEPNKAVAPLESANDPYFASQWHLPKIRATEAWEITTGSPDDVIAILYSGIDPTHPDLAAKLVPGWNTYDGNADASDVYGHGTKVAGSAAAIANNGLGVASVAWQSRLMPIRVTDTAGYGYYSTISQGITWAADHGARVMNISFASVAASSAIANAASYARSKGALVVAAAGNCGCDDPTAENPHLISVGATTTTDALATFSSRGAYVDVAAPGSGIYTTVRGGGYASVAGTSFASPVTAGVIALLMAGNPDVSANEIEEALESTALDLGAAGHDPSFGFGRIDAAAALAAAGATTPPPPDTTPPSAAITAPTDGQAVAGTTTVSVLAFDDIDVAAVDLYVDGIVIATDVSAPYSFAWNTTMAANGGHSLQAVARDGAGNLGASDTSDVVVDNAATAPTPTPTPAPNSKRKGGGGGPKRK
ncbi:MAG: S8 family serine peptidase, partial [Candidatus Binatia bacterium]